MIRVKNIPKAAGLNICFFRNRIKYLEIIANDEANTNFPTASSLESTKPTINPVIIELSVIRKTFVLRYRMVDSASKAEIIAVIVVTRNTVFLSLIDKKTAKQIKYRIN
jgi:hypothetical protein